MPDAELLRGSVKGGGGGENSRQMKENGLDSTI